MVDRIVASDDVTAKLDLIVCTYTYVSDPTKTKLGSECLYKPYLEPYP
jgi:hypothetical protein